MIILKPSSLKSNRTIHKKIVELLPLWNEYSQAFHTNPKVNKDTYINKLFHAPPKAPITSLKEVYIGGGRELWFTQKNLGLLHSWCLVFPKVPHDMPLRPPKIHK